MAADLDEKRGYNRFLLLVAGLGGLLYGVDVGIIAGALPYLEATSGLNAGQLSIIVAAVLLGSVISTLFAGMLADWMGRKTLMAFSGVLFVVSIPMIALAHGYGPLVLGRLLQGVSAGLIGVVVPLYLAECLVPSNRGKGTGIFQWLLTLGIVAAAAVGDVLQHSRGRSGEAGRCGEGVRVQGHGVAEHFLGFTAAGDLVRNRQRDGGRIAAMAFPPRAKGGGAGGAAAFAHAGTGRAGTGGDGGGAPRRRRRRRRAGRSRNRCCTANM